MVLQNSCEILDILLLHEYANVVLKLDITPRFDVCCEIFLAYKKRIKPYLGIKMLKVKKSIEVK